VWSISALCGFSCSSLPADFFIDEVAGGHEGDPPRDGAGGVMVGMDVRHDSADTVVSQPIDHELSGLLGVAASAS
jgi:hypothetical protein